MFRNLDTRAWEEDLQKGLATQQEIIETLGEKYVPESVQRGIDYNRSRINEFSNFNKYSPSLNAWLSELFETTGFVDDPMWSGLEGGWFGTVCRKGDLLIGILVDVSQFQVTIKAAEYSKWHENWYYTIIDRTKKNGLWQDTDPKKDMTSYENRPFFDNPINEATARHFADLAMEAIDKYIERCA